MKINLLAFSLVLITGAVFSIQAKGQDLDSLMEKAVKPQIVYATATFKSTRVVNGHSVERMKKNRI